MSNINKLNLIAKQIADELDRKDGNPDGKIDKSTWNDIFNVEEKGGKEISSHITIFNAEKSIKSYLKKTSDNENNCFDTGNEWLNLIQSKTTKKDIQEETDKASTKNNTKTSDYPKGILKISDYEKEPFASRVSTRVIKIPEIAIENAANTQKLPKIFTERLDTIKSKRKEIETLIKQEIEKRGLDESKVDIPYWTERITNVSSKFKIPHEIIVSIISKETTFAKNISNKYGKGAMALTGISIRSFFPSAQGNWNKIYELLDSDLLNDILYEKDEFGSVIYDSNGKPILKYKSAQELLTACGKDDELSIKVGSLILEMKYAEVIAQKKYGRATYANLPGVINEIKAGEITLSESENKDCVGQAIRNYNGCDTIIKRNGKLIAVKDDYKRDVMDSLNIHGYNFAEQNIICHS